MIPYTDSNDPEYTSEEAYDWAGTQGREGTLVLGAAAPRGQQELFMDPWQLGPYGVAGGQAMTTNQVEGMAIDMNNAVASASNSVDVEARLVRLGDLVLPPATHIPQTYFDYSTNASTAKLPTLTTGLGPARTPSLSPTSQSPKLRASTSSISKATDKAHKCPICKNTFNRLHDLKRHQILHQDVKPFQCPICMREFPRRDAMKRHFNVKPCGRKVSKEQEKVALEGKHHLKASTSGLKASTLSLRASTTSPKSPKSPRSPKQFPVKEESTSPEAIQSPTFSSMLSPASDPYSPPDPGLIKEEPTFTPTPPLISPGSTETDSSESFLLARSHLQSQQPEYSGMPPSDYLLPPMTRMPSFGTDSWMHWDPSSSALAGHSPAIPTSLFGNSEKLAMPSPDYWPASSGHNEAPQSDYFSSKASSQPSSRPSQLPQPRWF